MVLARHAIINIATAVSRHHIYNWNVWSPTNRSFVELAAELSHASAAEAAGVLIAHSREIKRNVPHSKPQAKSQNRCVQRKYKGPYISSGAYGLCVVAASDCHEHTVVLLDVASF